MREENKDGVAGQPALIESKVGDKAYLKLFK